MKREKNILTNSLLKTSSMVKIVGAVVGVLSSIIDGILINRFLGNESMSAYGLAMPMMLFYVAFGGMFATGIQSVVGNAIGKGDTKTINKTYTSTIIFSIILSTLIGLVFFIFAEPIAKLLGAKGDASYLLTETAGYIKGYSICAPIAILQYVLIDYVMLDGKGNLVTFGALALFIIDIAGDFLNIFVFKKGLFGMAFASSISIIACVLVLFLYFFKKNKLFKFIGFTISFKLIGKVCVGGLTFLCKQLSNILRSTLLNKIVILVLTSVGTLATLSLISTMRTLAFTTIGGIGESVFMIASIFVTEKDKKGLSNLLYASRKQSFAVGSILTIFLIALSGPLACLFINDLPFATSWGSEPAIALMLFFLSIIPYSFQYILRNYLLALRKNGQVYFSTIMNELILPVSMALLFAALFNKYGFFASFVASEIVTIIVMSIVTIIFKRKGVSFRQALLHLPKEIEMQSEIHKEFNSLEEVIDFSKESYDYILEKTNNKKSAHYISLAIEEIGVNVVKYGIKNKQNMGYARVIDTGENIVIRFRDNCGGFNPKKWVDNIKNKSDSIDHIGLKLVVGISDKVEYFNTLKMNNIVITLQKEGSVNI